MKQYKFLSSFIKAPFPYENYRQVFVENLSMKTIITGATMSILSRDLIHSRAVIEQAYITRPMIALALSHQWFGSYVSIYE